MVFCPQKTSTTFSRSRECENVGKQRDLIEMQAKKQQENKQKLIAYLAGKDRITNNEAEKLLGVSDASAERYLQELEKDGILRQVGKKGGWIYYEKIG